MDVYKTVPRKLRKYVAQRHQLFHRFDQGIQLDEEAWYSVTPEDIAKEIATRFAHLKVVVDLYSCVGGNSIQFAKAGLHVIAVEIDADKIEMAKHNALIYGVSDSIQFIHGDVFEVMACLRGAFDHTWGVFMSPPWGGPGYLEEDEFDISVFKNDVRNALAVSNNVGILIPRNVSKQSVVKHFRHCEIQDNYVGTKLKTKTLYFGALAFPGNAVPNVIKTKKTQKNKGVTRDVINTGTVHNNYGAVTNAIPMRTARESYGVVLDEVNTGTMRNNYEAVTNAIPTRTTRESYGVVLDEVVVTRVTQENRQNQAIPSSRLFGIERKWMFGLMATGLLCGGLGLLLLYAHSKEKHRERSLSLPTWFPNAWKHVATISNRKH